jgi:hypothetical protein
MDPLKQPTGEETRRFERAMKYITVHNDDSDELLWAGYRCFLELYAYDRLDTTKYMHRLFNMAVSRYL